MFRKTILALMVAIGLATLATFFSARFRYPRQQIKACFNDAQGLRAGAPVRIAGVDVGIVRYVQVNPQSKDCPAEVEMEVSTPYQISVPRDAVAKVAAMGVLGQSYVEIDTSQASGAPVENYGYLKSKPTVSLEDQIRALRALLETLEAAKKVPGDEKPSPHPSQPKP